MNILLIICAGAGIIAIWLYIKTARLKIEKDNLQERLNEAGNEIQHLKNEWKQKTTETQDAHITVAKLQADLKNAEERLRTQKNDFEEVRQNLGKEFKAIAGSILIDNSKTFTDQQAIKLNDLLVPFRQQIELFKSDVDAKFTHEAKEKGSLKQQIEHLFELNQHIAKEALALTEALKGSTKKQGDWGEDILERILEYSGLQKDVHYFAQQEARNDDGQKIRPDIVVRYPDKRYLVIDAKVSLVHYWDFCNAPKPEEQNAYLPKILTSVKLHIDGLAAKKYTDFPDTPDFIIMFMPVEAAYITAMQYDHALWQYAYDRKILLISPTNLLPAMKMVSMMWEKDAANKNYELIINKAVKLYEKFCGFINTFDSVGSEIEQAHNKWSDARRQLHTGKDNFINQGSKLKMLLGKKTSKEISSELIEAANLEDETATNTENGG